MSLTSVYDTIVADAKKVAPIAEAALSIVSVADPAASAVIAGVENVVKEAVTAGITLVNDVETVWASLKPSVESAIASLTVGAAAPMPTPAPVN